MHGQITEAELKFQHKISNDDRNIANLDSVLVKHGWYMCLWLILNLIHDSWNKVPKPKSYLPWDNDKRSNSFLRTTTQAASRDTHSEPHAYPLLITLHFLFYELKCEYMQVPQAWTTIKFVQTSCKFSWPECEIYSISFNDLKTGLWLSSE